MKFKALFLEPKMGPKQDPNRIFDAEALRKPRPQFKLIIQAVAGGQPGCGWWTARLWPTDSESVAGGQLDSQAVAGGCG